MAWGEKCIPGVGKKLLRYAEPRKRSTIIERKELEMHTLCGEKVAEVCKTEGEEELKRQEKRRKCIPPRAGNKGKGYVV